MIIRHIDIGTGIETLEEWMSNDLHEIVGGGDLIVSNLRDITKSPISIVLK